MTVAAVAAETHPDANILTQGFRTPLDRFPENPEVMSERIDSLINALNPRNNWQRWHVVDVAQMTLRLDRICRMDRRQRDKSALRAEFLWDHDRRLLAEDVGARLAKDPARVVKKLRATPQGCDWLIERWGWLRGIAEAGQPWDGPHAALAFDLLGLPADFRVGAAGRLSDPAGLVRAQVADLQRQKIEVADADALDRTMAMADLSDPDTAEYRRLRRVERATREQIRWSIEMIERIPKFARPHPDIESEHRLIAAQESYRMSQRHRAAEAARAAAEAEAARIAAAAATAIAPAEPPPLPAPWVPTTAIPPIPAPDLLPLPKPTPTPARRPDPAKLRAKARAAAARQRREDRPDR